MIGQAKNSRHKFVPSPKPPTCPCGGVLMRMDTKFRRCDRCRMIVSGEAVITEKAVGWRKTS